MRDAKSRYVRTRDSQMMKPMGQRSFKRRRRRRGTYSIARHAGFLAMWIVILGACSVTIYTIASFMGATL